ncbi:MAG: DUF4843 domain-containing protein [Bacteroidaceae bacterium]|nr:DUF4843 domain-containing protein [Bacteroidaceae bacterium]
MGRALLLLPCLALLGLATACSEQEYKLYDTTQKDAVYFQYRNPAGEVVDRIDYVFNYDIAQVHTLRIPVSLMGMPSTAERHIALEVVADSTDMVEGVNYTIDTPTLKPQAVSDTLSIHLLRDRDPSITSRAKRLTLRIGEGNDLRGVGNSTLTIVYSDIRPTLRPEWWSTSAALPVYSFETAQLFFEYFYRYAPAANRDVFNEMVAAYGDYFVNAKLLRGPIAMYREFLNMYVLRPLYNEHPELQWQRTPNF